MFDPGLRLPRRRPPRRATCPKDWQVSGHRVCPNCHMPLPHYVGQSRHGIIAVTGCRGVGKTVFHWALLHQLFEQISHEKDPYRVAMFEDDRSAEFYYGLQGSLCYRGHLPEGTRRGGIDAGLVEPVITRLLKRQSRQTRLTSLIFYDHAGELVESLKDISYLRYLMHASALIYLVDPQADDPGHSALGLNAIIHEIRQRTVSSQKRLLQHLAVVINKSDVSIFPQVSENDGYAKLVPGYQQSSAFWRTRDAEKTVEATSENCKRILADLNYHNLINLTRNFRKVSFFAASSLGREPTLSGLPTAPNPIGVADPLWWILRELD